MNEGNKRIADSLEAILQSGTRPAWATEAMTRDMAEQHEALCTARDADVRREAGEMACLWRRVMAMPATRQEGRATP
jgi:hypothetical protein